MKVVSDGWLDIQVNGFAGNDLSSADLKPEQLLSITLALRQEGVAEWCPTLITSSFERTMANIHIIMEACHRFHEVGDAVAGIHLEGPYLSPLDGVRGVHSLEHIRKPDWDEFCLWQEAAGGAIRIITLAPEVEGAIEFIRRVSTSGVVAAIGHSLASSEEIAAAVEAGARLATHLGNGIAAQIHRHKNPIWDQLAEDQLYSSVIFDGFHLPPNVMKVLWRAKGAERLILTSDASPLARLSPGVYETTVGGKAELHPSGKLTIFGSDEYLAGSASSLKDCIENAVRLAGLSLEQAIIAAAQNPRRLLGIESCKTRTVFDWDEEDCKLTVIDTLYS
jgi:N-acetylglucosamine-6-phosphate deacetylase